MISSSKGRSNSQSVSFSMSEHLRGVGVHADPAQERAVIERLRTKYRLQDSVFAFWDRLRYPFSSAINPPSSIDKASIRKLLLVNAGHIGDVVISTALLPLLNDEIPGVSIGFLTGDYSRHVLEHHPHVAKVHTLNHWYQSRGNQGRLASYFAFRRQAQSVIEELRDEAYDVAIDLRAWFPSLIPILYKARIPVRVGYDRVGGGPLLTHRFKYQYDRKHELHHQLRLLAPLNIDPARIKCAKPWLPLDKDKFSIRNIDRLFPTGDICLLHPGSSTSTRDWPLENWVQLAQYLADQGKTPVVTGKGPRDAALAAAIADMVPSAINLCNALSWEELLNVISAAAMVYSVETSIGHIAAALGRPVVSIYGGMADPQHWGPIGARIVTNPVPCSPCFIKQGCSHRACITGVRIEQVVAIDNSK